MAKGKPRWKDLTTAERLVKRAKQRGASESTLDFLRERAERKKNQLNHNNNTDAE